MSKVGSVAEFLAEAKNKLIELNDLILNFEQELNDPQPTTEPDKPPVKKETIREKLAVMAANGHSADVQELLHRYGAKKLSEINPDDYESLMADAEAMCNAT